MNKKVPADPVLYVALLQSDLYWEDRQANLQMFAGQLETLKGRIGLAILPETFTTGFTMNVEEQAMDEKEIVSWMTAQSSEGGFYITGSVIVKSSGKYYNRQYMVAPDGSTSHYDKRHLFRIGGEGQQFTRGEERVVATVGEFRILLQICYDLRFPVFSRNRGDYDAIIYVTNWPAARKKVWDILLRARAIENQAFVMAVSRTGTDGQGIYYHGGSVVISPKGEVMAQLDHRPGILLTALDIQDVRNFREKFPVYMDADAFRINGIRSAL